MNYKHLLLAALCCPLIATAQVAQWVIPPTYEKIDIPEGSQVLLAENGNEKAFWSFDGQQKAQITDLLYPYNEGYCVTTRRDYAYITAIYDANGDATPITDYQLGWGYPLFHDGHLLVHDGHYYHFMDPKGKVDPTSYATAYPFSGGYASCLTYENLQKKKSPYYLLIDRDLKPVPLSVDGKAVNRDDVEFVSSVNNDGVAIVVIKHKLYYFDASTRQLRPVLPSLDDTNVKNQAKLERDIYESITNVGDTAQVLKAKSGRSTIEIRLSSMLQPTAVVTDGQAITTYSRKPITQQRFTTHLRKHLGDDGKMALYYDDTEALPPQFTQVPLCFDDKAIVVSNGRQGVLRIHPNDYFRFSMNKGTPIAFRHKSTESTIRLTMPSYITPDKVSIDLTKATGMRIDKVTKESRASDEGNYLQYTCMLDMPQHITDEATTLSYPLRISYDGLISPVINAQTQAWHYQYYHVDVNEQETEINGNTLSFTFDINAERLPGEEIYPYTAKLLTDSLPFDMEKVSETHYKCKVYNLREGNNNIVVQVVEEGCPPASYSFEALYEKPVEQPQQTQQTKQPPRNKVVIKKTKKTPVTPILEI